MISVGDKVRLTSEAIDNWSVLRRVKATWGRVRKVEPLNFDKKNFVLCVDIYNDADKMVVGSWFLNDLEWTSFEIKPIEDWE